MDLSPSPQSNDTSLGIELTLRNLSLSIIPPPSFLTRTARKLRLTSDPYKQRSENTDVGTSPGAVDGAAPKAASDLRNVGINIYRNVDLTVKPGQGSVFVIPFKWWSNRAVVLSLLSFLSFLSFEKKPLTFFAVNSSLHYLGRIGIRKDHTLEHYCWAYEWSRGSDIWEHPVQRHQGEEVLERWQRWLSPAE
jgi:hypothetical protein